MFLLIHTAIRLGPVILYQACCWRLHGNLMYRRTGGASELSTAFNYFIKFWMTNPLNRVGPQSTVIYLIFEIN